MIISASYKTDIPAFYGNWFLNRLRAGYCKMTNPYNRNQISRISLLPADVDGIVFWTKNLAPFHDVLKEVALRQVPFIVQYTINSYPRALESRVVSAERSAEDFRRLAGTYGSACAVWRYDTIVTSSLTPPDFHRKNFESIAKQLEGSTDEVVVSYAQIYRKTERNMNEAARLHEFEWWDPGTEEKAGLLQDLSRIATSRGMTLKVCSQKSLLGPGVAEARCVDAERISAVAGKRFEAKLQGNRKECGCYQSRDIGEYDTCPHGCVYCYAVHNRDVAARRFKDHDPAGEFLFSNAPGESSEPAQNAAGDSQLSLFGSDGQNSR